MSDVGIALRPVNNQGGGGGAVRERKVRGKDGLPTLILTGIVVVVVVAVVAVVVVVVFERDEGKAAGQGQDSASGEIFG